MDSAFIEMSFPDILSSYLPNLENINIGYIEFLIHMGDRGITLPNINNPASIGRYSKNVTVNGMLTLDVDHLVGAEAKLDSNRKILTIRFPVDNEKLMDGKSLYIGYTRPINNDSIWADTKVIVNVQYSHNPPEKPTSLSPEKSVLNPRTPIVFSWDNKYNQTKFRIRYKIDSGAYYYIERASEKKNFEMPADTIKSSLGTLFWSVQTAGEEGVYSDWTDTYFELGTATQVPPIISSPKGDFLYGNIPILFEWNFIANTIEKQALFELEYTLDKNITTKTIKGTTAETNYLLEHNHNSSTTGKWRVKVTNNYGEQSEWAEWEEFNIVGIPPIPQIIDVTNTNRPIISWNSREQAAYQIVVKDIYEEIVFDSDVVLDEISREYKLVGLLPNGKYRFELTILNAYNIASPTATFTLWIKPEPIEVPTIVVHEDDYYVLVSSDVLDGQVLRNGHHIGNLVNGQFYDYTGENKRLYNYMVRNIVDDVYGDSESVSAKVNFMYGTIALLSKPDEFIKLHMSLNDLPEQSINIQQHSSSHSIDGLPYPVFEYGEQTTETITISYFMWQVKEVRKLIEAKEELIYRDDNAEVFIGNVTGLNYNRLFFGDDFSFVLTKTRDAYE